MNDQLLPRRKTRHKCEGSVRCICAHERFGRCLGQRRAQSRMSRMGLHHYRASDRQCASGVVSDDTETEGKVARTEDGHWT